ncbi:YopX family protein [Lactiplantibacillus plantarum]|uniref:YopX family protein n=1 Tax=Lactiplantibacillus plantarum TaxID=1590 RepID=UPI0021026567|nr:YopX family protein [Lactiplantibacillus plantarum]MDN7039255.1 hypothetical protein [Lactiplantibacillus plantarum]UTV82597.1 YopX family protein [Lactiplantibacillus plantarum]
MIKFRAWDKVQKVMMVPRDIQTDSDGNIFYVEAMGPDGEYDEGGLDVFKLEQFTGLTDVNGKDIYEGDIVRILSINVISDIKYMRDGVTPEFEIDRKKVFDEDNVLGTATCESDVEIIGNVHENPELLEGHK